MAKRTHSLAPLHSQSGQISIFFSASLVVLISIVAFVINIGLFVKAKINLQNATDAAAYAGASVQSRQLTTLSYLNWEMRNIYKEWMFKYYVVGNMNIKDVEDPSGDGAMSFRLEPDKNAISGAETKDPFNIPAVCIHLASSQTNICKRFAIPGLPEFGSYNLPGAEEASRAFMDSLIGAKITDCIDRTRLNMLVASTWAYNVLSSNMDQTLVGQGPAILADRQGAWPKAIEVAIRMRNLEFAMNKDAETGGVCSNTGNSSNISCAKNISDVSAENHLGNERVVKAFYSGYRNLGNETENEMKSSFTLTEISPTLPELGNERSASYLLVPNNKRGTYKKKYVDLKLMMVNLSTFYAAMIPRSERGGSNGTTGTSGACDVSKIAIPVPGYPMGFYKNPDVVTYYAVKGEADFEGMFNPFGSGKIKLTAYSAAKPFGGRIGPMLFQQRQGQDGITSRSGSFPKSVPYISSLDITGVVQRNGSPLAPGQYFPGAPLPIDQPGDPFWFATGDSNIGGLLNDSNVQFGIPNLVYDYQTLFSSTGYTVGGMRIHTIKSGQVPGDMVGLHSKAQFAMFKGTNMTGEITPEKLRAEINRVKAPTIYEAANYLIPTPMDFNRDKNLDSFGFIYGNPTTEGDVKTYNASIYAPLYSGVAGDALYQSTPEVVSSIFEFMRIQKSAMDKYRKSLNQAAYTVFDMKKNITNEALGSASQYEKSAKGISDINFTMPPNLDQQVQSCTSVAGSFLHFYYGHPDLFNGIVPNTAGCPTTLGEQLTQYFGSGENLGSYDPLYYKMEYSWRAANFDRAPHRDQNVLTAYVPGTFNGVGDDGTFRNTIQGSDITENMRRNFYSTKFITLDSVLRTGSYTQAKGFNLFSEGSLNSGSEDRKQTSFLNPLNPGSANADISPIKY